MEKLVIEGGRALEGKLVVMGSKNSATKLMAASLLFETPLELTNVPDIDDVKKTAELLTKLGGIANFGSDGILQINARNVHNFILDSDIAKNMRASIVFLGPLLARFGRAVLPHPGGCVIGKRPIDFFVDGFRRLGAEFKEEDNLYKFSAGKLLGTEIFLPFPSVTATETLMMAATLADGNTVIKNSACEPEIKALANFLSVGGAKIKGAGTNTIAITGRGGKLLQTSGNPPYHVIPDRIEAGSFAILGALIGNPLEISNCQPKHLESLIFQLENAGVKIERGENRLIVSQPEKLNAVSIATAVYPGFATDLQSPFAVLLTQAEGESKIFETVFEGRLNYLEELKRMGANIIPCDPHRAIIIGPAKLHGRRMESPDLRAGLAFIIAALIAEGESEIHNIYHIDRGYSRIEKRLSSVGAKIERIS